MMKKLFFLLLSFFFHYFSIQAQSGYQELPVNLNGDFYSLHYKIHHSNPEGRQVLIRDFVTFHLQTFTEDDSLLKSSYPTGPLVKEISVEDYRYADKGFMQEMLLQLKVEDSATFLLPAADLFDAIKRPRPTFIGPDSKLKYVFKILDVRNYEEVKKDNKNELYRQSKVDEKEVVAYATKNLEEPKKTYSGIWYKIHHQGEGDFALEDDVVAIRYVGKFLDGKVFNSSDRDGRLLEFPVNQGFVIKGLDEAMLLLKKGAKATFIVPSYLAYGEEGWGALIPPNTPLIFEIEFVDIVSRKIIIESKAAATKEPKKDDPEKAREKMFQEI